LNDNPGAESAPTGTLEVLPLGVLLAKDIPDREPMLGPWLQQRHLSMVYAPTGVGKSLFTMAAGLAVAGGGSFLGWRAPKARRVLLVDGEMDVLDLRDRARMLIPTIAKVDREAAASNLHVLAQQAQGPGVKFPDLADQAGRAAIIETVTKLQAELVILDNFSTLATVEDENTASSFDPVINLMRDLKQAGCACILVHHARKGNGGDGSYRGTSKMGVLFNSILELRHPGGIQSTTGAAFETRWEKFRGRLDETMRPLKVKLEGKPEGPLTWTWAQSEDAQLADMIVKLKSLEYPTQQALADALSITPGALSKWKRKAIAQGLIRETEWEQCLNMMRAQADEPTAF
jgi:KaiC/GvpD/RAD55 family RecA-like ATPase